MQVFRLLQEIALKIRFASKWRTSWMFYILCKIIFENLLVILDYILRCYLYHMCCYFMRNQVFQTGTMVVWYRMHSLVFDAFLAHFNKQDKTGNWLSYRYDRFYHNNLTYCQHTRTSFIKVKKFSNSLRSSFVLSIWPVNSVYFYWKNIWFIFL